MSKDHDEHLAQLMAETERAERQRERLRLRAMDTVFPEDMSSWLDTLQEKRLPKELKALPDSLRKEFGDLIHGQIKAARRAIGEGDDSTLKENILIITDNLARMVENQAIHAAKRSKSKGTKGGEANKQRVWAALVAGELSGHGKPPEIWKYLKAMATSSTPYYVENDAGEFEVFIDYDEKGREAIFGVNTLTRHSQSLVRDSFLRKYVRELKKGGSNPP